MRKLWNRLSHLGLTGKPQNLRERSIKLSNRINLGMILLLLPLIGLTTYDLFTKDQEFTLFTSRLFILLGFNVLNLYLTARGNFRFVQFSTSLIPVLVIIIIPTLLGYVQSSSFFYYHIIVIGFSLVPHLIFVPHEDTWAYRLSLVTFFILMWILDDLMIEFAMSERRVIEIIGYFNVYFKIIPVTIFCFLHLAMYHLRGMNSEFEKNLFDANATLKSKIDELRQTQKHLVQSEKMVSMGTMVAGIAHEINNPLNYIKGGVDLIERQHKISEETPDSVTSNGIQMIKEGATRAQTIIHAMTAISYKDSKQLQSIQFDQFLENTLLLMKSTIPEDIELVKQIELKDPLPVMVEKLHQVFVNLIDNAVQAIATLPQEKAKWIRIRAEKQIENGKPTALIECSNSGPAIPDEIMGRIFDPFFTTKDPGEGTGLGLSISYSLLQEHQGKIEAHNIKDGVKFILRLPLIVQGEEHA